MKSTKKEKRQAIKILLAYGVHIWVILFVSNIAITYAIHFFIKASSCMTAQQIQNDNRCLYSIQGKVYEKGNRDNPLNGYPCGSDITSAISSNRVNNPTFYVPSNYLTDLCSPITTSFSLKPTGLPTSVLITTISTSTPKRNAQIFAAAYTTTAVSTITPTPSLAFALTTSTEPTPTLGPITSENFNMITACFGDKASNPTVCTNKSLADLNGDGVVDGVDYNLFLIATRPSASATPVVSLIVITDTPTPIILATDTPTNTPTPLSLPTPTPVSKNAGIGSITFLARILAICAFLLLCGFVIFKFLTRKKLPNKSGLPTPIRPVPLITKQPAAVPDQPIAKAFFVKPIKLNSNTQTVELELVDDTSQHKGIYHYEGNKAIKEGFANIKGTLHTENGEQVIIVSDLTYVG